MLIVITCILNDFCLCDFQEDYLVMQQDILQFGDKILNRKLGFEATYEQWIPVKYLGTRVTHTCTNSPQSVVQSHLLTAHSSLLLTSAPFSMSHFTVFT